jgi:hypothetical protein
VWGCRAWCRASKVLQPHAWGCNKHTHGRRKVLDATASTVCRPRRCTTPTTARGEQAAQKSAELPSYKPVLRVEVATLTSVQPEWKPCPWPTCRYRSDAEAPPAARWVPALSPHQQDTRCRLAGERLVLPLINPSCCALFRPGFVTESVRACRSMLWAPR